MHAVDFQSASAAAVFCPIDSAMPSADIRFGFFTQPDPVR
jgi:hypothetical protein